MVGKKIWDKIVPLALFALEILASIAKMIKTSRHREKECPTYNNSKKKDYFIDEEKIKKFFLAMSHEVQLYTYNEKNIYIYQKVYTCTNFSLALRVKTPLEALET